MFFNTQNKLEPVKTRIVIAGCGFGGIACAFELKKRLGNAARIIAIDRSESFDYHASLPELVSSKVREGDITIPYWPLFEKAGIEFVQSQITGVDRKGKTVSAGGKKIKYDCLVLSLGSQTEFYGVPGAKENSYEFKSWQDALALRNHCIRLFETCSLVGKDTGATRVVVIGGGLTGVELVTDLGDLLRNVCERCKIPQARREIVLIGRSERLSVGFSEPASAFAESYLKSRGISVMLGDPVVKVNKGEVVLQSGKKIRSMTIVWCAGIRPNGVVQKTAGGDYNPKCGLVLNKYLQCDGDPSIFALGDCGYCSAFEVQPILTAWRAIEQADYVSHNLCCHIKGEKDNRMMYAPRIFPALISLGRGMGLLCYEGMWKKGRHIAWLKKIMQHVHMARFRHNWEFLEYLDEFFISALELAYFFKVRGK